MKIGFVVSFFDFRNDVRRVIAEVSKHHEAVILGRSEQRDEILRHLPEGLEFRVIRERKNSLWNRFWIKAFILFKRIPKSRHNFFLMELFKASHTSDPAIRKKNYVIIEWVRRLPKIISYDTYLKNLEYQKDTDLSGIDQFVCFTAIADDFLLARLLHEKYPVKVYVYSWDHACKHICFSERARYVCWNEPIKEDIIHLQHIPATNVKVVGASQFAYIDEYRKVQSQLPRTYPFPYVYFGGAIGIDDLVKEEVNVAISMANTLAKTRPDLRLIVRPYPVQLTWEVYQPLRSLPNVIMDDGYRTVDLSVKDGHILEKFEKIANAEAFFHMGTTMGLEACFTNTPSFIIDYGYQSKEGLSLYSFIHQYQNDRHLIDLAPQNAVRSETHLAEILKDLANPTYRLLNEKVQAQYEVKSFQKFSEDLLAP
ncbi:hypothetical protein [Runella slithyformis]|uniref:Uncharacterized protein n=1 Tax=Runella slithyformis (strain ATCC 29530 / DSM 19594 / LMG 11500 / NCIMB 11436 / LSU 4) TaxID=761193 RepID=A0A7U3ZI20_RUNSL|nr:hypothetical protein [Runella slithyformis]AEI47599.1 hypothetical protein Runsl_1170 [Runella slithyformis DSM 19594]